ncbi:MAG TPA: hypothetical protein PK668_28060 [Myxococcota bacterium]|nr:hypothetical protein [Myxococcota bacterium]HRY97353.1 hypothetical protein [Myxococcota bacterium]
MRLGCRWPEARHRPGRTGLLAGLGPDEHILAKPVDVGSLLAAVQRGYGAR